MTFKKQTAYFKKSAEEKYKRAVKQWGESAQINMIIEEAGELCEAAGRLVKKIMKVNRANNDKEISMSLLLLENEIADLHIMIEQAYFIFDGNNIRKIRNEKLKRLDKRLNGYK